MNIPAKNQVFTALLRVSTTITGKRQKYAICYHRGMGGQQAEKMELIYNSIGHCGSNKQVQRYFDNQHEPGELLLMFNGHSSF